MSGSCPAMRQVPTSRAWSSAGHDLVDQRAERFDAGAGCTVADHLGSVDAIGGQVGQRAVASVLAFDAHRPPARSGRPAGMPAATGLHAGPLIGNEHVVVLAQWLAVEDS